MLVKEKIDQLNSAKDEAEVVGIIKNVKFDDVLKIIGKLKFPKVTAYVLNTVFGDNFVKAVSDVPLINRVETIKWVNEKNRYANILGFDFISAVIISPNDPELVAMYLRNCQYLWRGKLIAGIKPSRASLIAPLLEGFDSYWSEEQMKSIAIDV